jgi:restriction endonuclease Mrr
LIVLLEQVGVEEIAVVRRPGTHGAELHLSGKSRSAAGHVPVAIVIRRDGKDVGRERVTELRGALHHYGPAAQGWIITTGQVLSGAREEAAVLGAAPVALTDGMELARLCEQLGVGVSTSRVELPVIDVGLFETLRA